MLRILLQKAFISQICYANDKSLFLHPAISPRNTLEICECRRASGAMPSGHGTAAFPRPSRAENSSLCATPIPNRTFATPYVSRPFLSHARPTQQRHVPAARDPAFRLPLGTGVEIAQPPEIAVGAGLENEYVDLVRRDADGRLVPHPRVRLG